MRLFLLLSVYRLLLNWLCSIFYAWRGFEYSFTFDILSWFIFAGSFSLFRIIVLLSKRMDDVLKFLLLLLYMASYLPFTSLIAFRRVSIPLIIHNSIYFLILGTVCRLGVEFCDFKIPLITVGRRLLTGICVVIASVCLYISYRYASFRLYLRFDDVYIARSAFLRLNISKFERTFFSVAAALLPYFASYFLTQRRLIITVLCTVSIITSYCTCGSKFLLFTLVIGYIIVLFPSKKISIRGDFFCYLGIAVSLITVLALKVSCTNVIADVASRCLSRILFALNFMIIDYFHFFIETHHPPECYLKILSHFINVPVRYHSDINPVPLVIAKTYYGNEDWCCCGLLGIAVMRLGYPGIFVMPFVSAFLVLFFSKLVVALADRLQIFFSGCFIICIMNGNTYVHFLFPLFFCLWLMGSAENSKKSCNSVSRNFLPYIRGGI